jgi:hypothetical protein
MNSLARVFLLVVFAFMCASQSHAQTNTEIPQSPPATIEGKFAIVRNADRTIVTLAHQKVGGDSACGLFVTAGYLYQGKLTEPPKRIWLSIVRDTADEPRLLKSPAERELTLTVDGEVLTLGAMPSVKEVLIGYSLMHQGLLIQLPFQTFSKIANAKKVDAKLGSIKFKLTDKNLTDFRDLVKRISKEIE